jgi:hypothetical protein
MSISEKVKRAYKDLRSFAGENHPLEALADAFLHERAMRLKAEWQAKHFEVKHADSAPGKRLFMCLGCNYSDDRHTWTDAQWEEEVEKELR